MAEEEKFAFARAALGLTRLVQLDLRAVDLFEKTGEAAWRSMRYLVYCVPLVIAISWFSPRSDIFTQITGFSRLEYALITAEVFLISALGFMLVVYQLGLKLGYNKNFAHYVNTQCAIALPIVILLGLLMGTWRLLGVPPQAEQFLQMLVYALQIVVDWAITYGTLRIKPAAAFGICVLGVLFGILTEMFVHLVIFISVAPETVMSMPQ